MIVGLVGAICSGKEALALYLKEHYGFECINLLALFKERYNDIIREHNILASPMRKKDTGQENGDGESKEDESFCFEYYMSKLAFIED